MPLCLICGEEIEVGEHLYRLVSGKIVRDEFGGKDFEELDSNFWTSHCHISCIIGVIKKGAGVKKNEIQKRICD